MSDYQLPQSNLGDGFGRYSGHANPFHFGQDYKAPLGSPVPAAADGIVYYTGSSAGYGNVVILKHFNSDGSSFSNLARVA